MASEKLRLVFQGSVPVVTAEQAEQIYNEIKIFVRSWSDDSKTNGQIIKMLEPCCPEKKGAPGNEPPS